MRISDWSSDVCSSDLGEAHALDVARQRIDLVAVVGDIRIAPHHQCRVPRRALVLGQIALEHAPNLEAVAKLETDHRIEQFARGDCLQIALGRSEEQTSELQSLMRISYAVFCMKTK